MLRSNSPTIRVTVSPAAISAVSDDWLSTFSRLSTVKNAAGEWIENPTTIAASAISVA